MDRNMNYVATTTLTGVESLQCTLHQKSTHQTFSLTIATGTDTQEQIHQNIVISHSKMAGISPLTM